MAFLPAAFFPHAPGHPVFHMMNWKGDGFVSVYIIVSRSLTYAQRYARLFTRNGHTANVVRLPLHLSQTGCGYGVRIPEHSLRACLAMLQQWGVTSPVIYKRNQDNQYEEFPL